MSGMASSKPLEPRSEVDRVTLAGCKTQDSAAFRAFVSTYERAVFALLSRVLGRGPHVEDLAQETFLRAYRAFPRFDVDVEARPSTWLLTIAVRLALNAKK
jgi:RNA polymerase sigma-70 factor (ECF subfamily)